MAHPSAYERQVAQGHLNTRAAAATEYRAVDSLCVMRRYLLAGFVTTFILSRLLLVFFASQPVALEASYGDLLKYETWGTALAEERSRAYSSQDLEYPPGVLPFLSFARAITPEGGSFAASFARLMLLLDIISFAGVVLLWRRWGSPWGPAVWIGGVPLVGPVLYLRLDLIPATFVIWAIVAAAYGWWSSSGATLAIGALAKIYPVFLVIPFLKTSPHRDLFSLGFVAAVVAAVLPFAVAGGLPDLVQDVAGYHAGRGVQLESTWGAALLVASKLGYPVALNFEFGALHVVSGSSSALKTVGLVLSLLALSAGTVVALLTARRGELERMTLVMFGILASLLFFGTVYSPQFTIWLVGAAAVALCSALPRNLTALLLLVLPIALLTQIVFPHGYGALTDPYFGQDNEPSHSVVLTALVLRNVLVGAAGFSALALVAWMPRSERSSRRRALGFTRATRPRSHDQRA